MVHCSLFIASFSLQRPHRLESVPLDDRHVLLDRFMSVARSHRLEQRSFKKGDHPHSLFPESHAVDETFSRKRRRTSSGSEEQEAATTSIRKAKVLRRHGMQRSSRGCLRENDAVFDEAVEQPTESHSMELSNDVAVSEKSFLPIDIWVSQYLSHFKLVKSQTSDQQHCIINNPFSHLSSMDISEVKSSSTPTSSSTGLSTSSHVIQLLCFQLFSLLITYRYNRSHGTQTSLYRPMSSLFSHFPFSFLARYQRCSQSAAIQASLTDYHNCSICNLKGTPFASAAFNPLVLSLLSLNSSNVKLENGKRRSLTEGRGCTGQAAIEMCDNENLTALLRCVLSAFGATPFYCEDKSQGRRKFDSFRAVSSQDVEKRLESDFDSSTLLFPGNHPDIERFLISPTNASSGSWSSLLVGPFRVSSTESPNSESLESPMWMHDYCFILTYCQIMKNLIRLPHSEYFNDVSYSTPILSHFSCIT